MPLNASLLLPTVTLALTLLSVCQPLAAAEEWADDRLKVTDGLMLWLDASRLNAARQALGGTALQPGDRLEVWPDASGKKRHVSQPEEAKRPRYQPTDDFHAVRFDGKTALRWSGEQPPARDLTVFVVTAPYSSPEMFSALFAASARNRNDFQTGLNIDQAGGGLQAFQVINVEGSGAQGAQNLLQTPSPYGSVLRIRVTSSPGKEGVTVAVNGKPQGKRDRQTETLVSLEEIIVGARYYNLGTPPEVRGFLDGDIAEVLVYNRALTAAEQAEVERYLEARYARVPVLPVPGPAVGKPLVRVRNPPAVQMLTPGFIVRELPVQLSNVNNLLYRPDGKLVALGYDGNVWLLSDEDGDGLEEKVLPFWENAGQIRSPIGMALTPPKYRHGEGVFVACKGKCSLLTDTDGDGRADREIVVAQGWQELPHGVDALGVAVHPEDGSVYFGLGTQDFTNAYQTQQNKPYPLQSERGTILRVSPDFQQREIVATGIRFPVGLRFNRQGDLFCSDQEGATWLPNGNPLDELLQIQPGRHYGFPPRHPKWLPDVIDEPSVYDYRPQHQSTCGLNFNESVNGGPAFGPDWWRSDALVAGYSRGKLYRTQLVKTETGYVAQNQLLACLKQLPADVCVSPQGELVVAVHSGGPDWGSGPTGQGQLYKITWQDREAPQPVLAWSQTPREVRIAFDRPLAPLQLRGLKTDLIEYGRYVSAGDRFESLWPGYKVVQDQQRSPRQELPVYRVQVTPDQRTLILTTAVHPEPVEYAVTLPGVGYPETTTAVKGELPQHRAIDLQYNLNGVAARWKPSADGEPAAISLPHLESAVNRPLTKQSAGHDDFWRHCEQPGELTLSTLLDLQDMLRPAVQPGAQIDYQWPAEQITLTLQSPQRFTAQTAGSPVPAEQQDNVNRITLTLKPAARVPLQVTLPTGTGQPELRVSWHTAEDPRPRALPLRRLLLPWAPEAGVEPAFVDATEVPELAGGNWERGRQVFFSEQAACSKCHKLQGQGAEIGPDLSNLPHRDFHSVLRDVTQPNFAINPDFIPQVVVLQDGRTLTGLVSTREGKTFIGDKDGKLTPFELAEVEIMQPSRISIMPEGLPKQLGPEKLRDLLTFLLTTPPRMNDYGKGEPPAPRSREEIAAVLAGAPESPASRRPLKITLVWGRKDHGPGEHDYPEFVRVWSRLLKMADQVQINAVQDWPTAEDLKTADVLVFYQQGTWTPQRARDMDAYLARGGGVVYIHYAVDGGGDAPGFAQRIGLAWQGGRSKFRHGALDLGFETGAGHPVTRHFDKVHFHDESYWQLVGDPKRITLLAGGQEDGAQQPLFWTLEPSNGRVFVSILGHYSWTFDDPLFRILLLRGILWSANEPVDRFNLLALPGARVQP